MEFKDITTWTVTSDHKARPKNPYSIFFHMKYDELAKEHTYHCSPSLVAGEYPAEIFDKVVWQSRMFENTNWVSADMSIAIKNYADFNDYYEFGKSRGRMHEARQYLQLKQPTKEQDAEIKHELKTWPEYFEQVWQGTKPWELRQNDRDYKFGHHVILKEYDPKIELFTSREIKAIITYVLKDAVVFGLVDGYCILSLNIYNYSE